MKVIELKEGVVVKDLVVRVSRRWNIRSILNVNEEFSDDGPLKEEKTKVFNVLVRDETNPDDQSELMLFFYDLWAEKCFFIQNGDKITISGAHEMVHMSNGDLHDFPLCLVFTQDVISQITVESVNIDNSSRSTLINSTNLPTVVVPIWKGGTESHKRKRVANNAAIILPKKTSGIRFTTFETGNSDGATPYEYISLSAIPSYMGTKTKLNFYGVITSYQQPKSCNGKHQYSFTFTVVDPLHYPLPTESSSSSLAEASEPLLVQCFADTLDSFPPIRRVGDLIRLHRCNLQVFQNRPQILWFEQKSSYVLFSHPLADELIGLPSCLEENSDDELQELKLEEFPSSETYHIDESIERDYIQFLSVWKVAYFISTGYTDINPKPLLGSSHRTESSSTAHESNKFYNIPIQKMKEIISSQSPSISHPTLQAINTSNMDFIGMFVGLFPTSSDNSEGGNRYMYVWDGSCEGGIYPSTYQLPDQFNSNIFLKTSLNVYRRIELSVKIISQYNETLNQLPNTIQSSNSSSISSLLSILHVSLTDLIKERDTMHLVSRSKHDEKSRYLPGGFGILAIPANCISQNIIASTLQPGTWIRARKISIGSVEEISHLGRSETVSARLTVGSSVNVIPPFHCDVLALGKVYDQFRRTCLSAHAIPKSLPRRMYSASGQPYTPLALVLASPTPAKFLSLVKVVGYFPNDLENFVVCKSTGLPPVKSSITTESSLSEVLGIESDPNDLTFMFALRIHDDTAHTDAILFGQEGVTFFQGLSPHQFLSDHRIRSKLQSYLDKIIQDGVIFELNLITYTTPATPADAPASSYVKRVAISNSSILPLLDRVE